MPNLWAAVADDEIAAKRAFSAMRLFTVAVGVGATRHRPRAHHRATRHHTAANRLRDEGTSLRIRERGVANHVRRGCLELGKQQPRILLLLLAATDVHGRL